MVCQASGFTVIMVKKRFDAVNWKQYVCCFLFFSEHLAEFKRFCLLFDSISIFKKKNKKTCSMKVFFV